MSTANPSETKCQLVADHEGDHNPIYEVHKCMGNEFCVWCSGTRCEYELVTVKVWIRENSEGIYLDE